MHEWAAGFYGSEAWKECRRAYARSVGGLCEKCLSRGRYNAGEIVHHKRHLTAENINNPAISLGWDNLMLVCRDCHAEIHKRVEKRYDVDEAGRILPRLDPSVAPAESVASPSTCDLSNSSEKSRNTPTQNANQAE